MAKGHLDFFTMSDEYAHDRIVDITDELQSICRAKDLSLLIVAQPDGVRVMSLNQKEEEYRMPFGMDVEEELDKLTIRKDA